MHARYYAQEVGFGAVFESKVAAGMAAFVDRLDRPDNGIVGGRRGRKDRRDGGDRRRGSRRYPRRICVGSSWMTDDAGPASADASAKAVAFCDARGFAETWLWTFRGLDAARRLYEGRASYSSRNAPARNGGTR